MDTLTGTSNDDTFVGEVTASTASTNTVGSADEIAGGAGTDTLNITVSEIAGPANLAAITSTAVEKISVRNVDATPDAITVSGLNFAGATEFVADRSTAAIVFNDIGTADLTIAGNDAVTNGNVTFNGSQTASVTDALTVNVQGGVNAGVIVSNDANDDWTAVTINSTGGTATATTNANVLTSMDLAGGDTMQSLTINATSSLTTGTIAGWDTTGATTANKGLITITGAGAVNVGTLDAAVEDVVATDNSGGVTLTASTQTDFTFAGSSGNDRVTTNAVLGTSGSVDAAGGTDDRLIVNNTAHITSTSGALYTNFEALQVNDGVSVDLDNLSGIETIRINDGGGATGVTDLSAAQAAAITVIAGNAAGAITIGVKGADTVGQIDTVKITADDGASATSTVALGTPVIADVEKLELTAVDNITVAALTSAEALDSITLDGAGTISLTSGAITPENNTVVNGSNATGALTIDFGGVVGAATTNASLFIGGSGADTITTTGGAADIVNGGAGIDSITVTKDVASSGFADVQSDAIASADADLITGFVTTENDFDYNGALSNGTGAGAGIAATEVASAATIAAALATGGAPDDIVFIQTTDWADTGATINTFKGAATAANADAIEAALVAAGGALNGAIANLDTVLGASDSVLFQISDADDTIVVRVTNTDQSTANTLTADEIELVGVFGGTADLVAGDYV